MTRFAQQSVDAKKAEFGRPFAGINVLNDGRLAAMVCERAEVACADAMALLERGVALSPFLEIGAGSVQRSAALVNRFGADGVATDVSQNSLRDAPYVLNLLHYARAPMRICCDAHHLPFRDDTFQLIIAYQTLHHMDDPAPVVRECHRVLGRGGHLLFDEEPLDSPLRRLLRGRRMLSHPMTRAQKAAAALGSEKIFWDDGAHERTLGIVEARPDIAVWREALACFAEVETVVNRRLRIRSDLRGRTMAAVVSGVVGGNIRGLCQKRAGEVAPPSCHERLICLDCRSTDLMMIEGQPLRCRQCGRTYPVVDGVHRMLPAALEQHLCSDHPTEVELPLLLGVPTE